MTELRVLLAGMPVTGKTSYTAALWNLIESGSQEAGFEIVRLSSDREYLNTIRSAWLRADRPERTRLSPGMPVVLHLRVPDTDRSFDLYMPDRSGEVFEVIVADREWSLEFDQFVADLDGVLLFVHPEHVREPLTIQESSVTEQALAPSPAEVAPLEPVATPAPRPWSADTIPTQVQLVDLLQLLLSSSPRCPLRVGVIVSAWDVLGDDAPAPKHWVRDQLPLLDQYLRANTERIAFRVYGVSAYGGDPSRQGEELRSHMTPATRVRVIGCDAGPHDVSAPLRWLVDV